MPTAGQSHLLRCIPVSQIDICLPMLSHTMQLESHSRYLTNQEDVVNREKTMGIFKLQRPVLPLLEMIIAIILCSLVLTLAGAADAAPLHQVGKKTIIGMSTP